jgi:stringent starvation protein B
MTQLLPPKKEVALALLERSNVDVYLDPRAKGVVVPPQFRKEPRLILKIGLNMPVPIPDLRLDDESMSCTLSFNRSPFYCVVPWSSVFAMVGEDGRGMVWPDDVPQELAVKVVDPAEGGRAPSGDRDGARAEAPASPRRGGARGAARDRASRSSDDTPVERSARASKPETERKGKKKKKDEGRPVLAAVPPAPPSEREARSEAAGERARDRDHAPPESRRPGGPPSARDGVSPIPSPSIPNRASSHPRQPVPPPRRPDGTVARPKRELPPYLRVVK